MPYRIKYFCSYFYKFISSMKNKKVDEIVLAEMKAYLIIWFSYQLHKYM